MKLLKVDKRNIISAFILPTFLILSGCSNPILNNKVLNEGKAQILIDKFAKSYSATAKISGGVVQNEGASVAEAKVNFNNFTDSQYGTYSGPGVAAFNKYNDDTWALIRVTIAPPDSILSTRWYDTSIKE